MPISTKRFSELRLMVSDLLQRGDWARLFENCGTSDPELAKAVSGVFSMYEPSHVMQFVNYVLKLPSEIRRERRDSTSVACYILGRIGQFDTRKSIAALGTFLSDDHMLRSPVMASLANLWILDRETTEKELYSWILKGTQNEDLQEASVRSAEYLLSQDRKQVAPFIRNVIKLEGPKFEAARNAAGELHAKYLKSSLNRGPKRKRKLKPSAKYFKKKEADHKRDEH